MTTTLIRRPRRREFLGWSRAATVWSAALQVVLQEAGAGGGTWVAMPHTQVTSQAFNRVLRASFPPPRRRSGFDSCERLMFQVTARAIRVSCEWLMFQVVQKQVRQQCRCVAGSVAGLRWRKSPAHRDHGRDRIATVDQSGAKRWCLTLVLVAGGALVIRRGVRTATTVPGCLCCCLLVCLPESDLFEGW